MSDKPTENLAPWSVRGVPADVREAVAAYAKRMQMSVGEAASNLLRSALAAERLAGEQGRPNPRHTVNDNGSHAIDNPANHGRHTPYDATALGDMVSFARQMAEATGKPIPAGLAQQIYRHMRTSMHTLNGTAPRLSLRGPKALHGVSPSSDEGESGV